MAAICATFEKVWPIFIPSSGHTASVRFEFNDFLEQTRLLRKIGRKSHCKADWFGFDQTSKYVVSSTT